MVMKFTRAELFRTLKMKSMVVLSIILVVMFFFSNIVMIKLDMGAIIDEAVLDQTEEQGLTIDNVKDSAQLGYDTGSASVENDTSTVLWGKGLLYSASVARIFTYDMSELNVLLMISIFVGLFMGSVFTTGLDKNYTVANSRKEELFAARGIVIFIVNLYFMLLTLIVAMICVGVFGKSFKLGFDGKFFLYFFAETLLSFVFAMIVATITSLAKSKAAGITVGVLLSSGFFSILISLIDLLVHRLLGFKKFALTNYLVEQNIATLKINATAAVYTRVFVVALIYLAVAVTVSVITNRKRDLC